VKDTLVVDAAEAVDCDVAADAEEANGSPLVGNNADVAGVDEVPGAVVVAGDKRMVPRMLSDAQ